jgi:acetyl esterase/lipase
MKTEIIKKFFKYILMLFVIFFITFLVLSSYYLFFDRETKEPDEIQQICNISIEQYQNRKIFIVKPKNSESTGSTILYFHGGSYMAEATTNHWNFIQKLAVDTNSTVIMPDYPLAPKYNYIHVFDMVEPFYNELTSTLNVSNLIVMGDSAGGGLALGLMEKISNSNGPIPSKIILISPWLDTKLNNPQIDEFQKKDSQLNRTNLQLAGRRYAGENGSNSYLVNPIDGNISKLNNITIFIGTNDIFNPDVHLLQEKAQDENVVIDVKEYENAGHIWFIENNSSEDLIAKGYNDLLEVVNY